MINLQLIKNRLATPGAVGPWCVSALIYEIEQLRLALNDAINSPRGTVLKSAEPFYDGRVTRESH